MKKNPVEYENGVLVFDDFLSAKDFKIVTDPFLYGDINWRRSLPLTEEQVGDIEGNEILCDWKYNHQFVHYLLLRHQMSERFGNTMSPFVQRLHDMDYMLNPYSLIRAKVNLHTCTETVHEHAYHVDYMWPHWSGVFNMNTNDGYTGIKNGPKIESIANRLIIIPDKTVHTGTSCTNQQARIVLNFNWLNQLE